MASEVSKPSDFVPALVVVDMQEDFCPPVCIYRGCEDSYYPEKH